MKRTLSILLACLLLLTACGEIMPKAPDRDGGSSSSQDGGRSESDKSDEGSSSQSDNGVGGDESTPEADDPLPLISFNYAVETADVPKEFANILAFSQEGVVLWDYTTSKLDITELERVSPIGLVGDSYLFVCGGSVICLDAHTGQERWTNSDFDGAAIHFAIGDGIIYLCGYYGPDLFALSTTGKTVKKIDSLNADYYWPCEMELSEDGLIITMAGGPEGDSGIGHPIRVNLKDWSYEME